MQTIQTDYSEWFKELEATLMKNEITYLPSCFYGLIKWCHSVGMSPGQTCNAVRLHLTIFQQKFPGDGQL